MNYDVLIIGAGPGGIFSAYELIKRSPDLKVGVIEAGYPLEKRKCPIDGEKVKTCKEIGALKKFSEKVKNNPVWTVYQRTYKTRYARVSKGKMTKAEFEAWADNAKALREKALNNEITFEEFQAAISG